MEHPAAKAGELVALAEEQEGVSDWARTNAEAQDAMGHNLWVALRKAQREGDAEAAERVKLLAVWVAWNFSHHGEVVRRDIAVERPAGVRLIAPQMHPGPAVTKPQSR